MAADGAAARPRPDPFVPADGPDTAALGALLTAFADDLAVVGRFVRDYLDLLEDRVDDARDHTATGDVDQARRTLRSLEVSSRMVGAAPLAAAAADLHARVGREPPSSLEPAFSRLARLAERTRGQLLPLASR